MVERLLSYVIPAERCVHRCAHLEVEASTQGHNDVGDTLLDNPRLADATAELEGFSV